MDLSEDGEPHRLDVGALLVKLGRKTQRVDAEVTPEFLRALVVLRVVRVLVMLGAQRERVAVGGLGAHTGHVNAEGGVRQSYVGYVRRPGGAADRAWALRKRRLVALVDLAGAALPHWLCIQI